MKINTRARLHGGKFHGELVEVTQQTFHDVILCIPETQQEVIDFGRTKLVTFFVVQHKYIRAPFNVRSDDGYQIYTFQNTLIQGNMNEHFRNNQQVEGNFNP